MPDKESTCVDLTQPKQTDEIAILPDSGRNTSESISSKKVCIFAAASVKNPNDSKRTTNLNLT